MESVSTRKTSDKPPQSAVDMLEMIQRDIHSLTSGRTSNEPNSGMNNVGFFMTKAYLQSHAERLARIEIGLDFTNNEMKAIKSDVEAIKSDVEAIRSDVTSTKVDMEAMRSEITSTKVDVEAMRSEIESMKTGIARILEIIESNHKSNL